jgi:hypothetical protein
MRKLLLLLLVALPAFAQYTAPGAPQTAGTVGFWAAGLTSNLSASTTSASIALSVYAGQVQVYNSTSATAFVVFTVAASPTAHVGSANTTTSDYPVAAGAVVVVTVPNGAVNAAAILSSSSGAVFFTPGLGL